MKTKQTLIACACLLALLLTACGSGASTGEATSAIAGAPTDGYTGDAEYEAAAPPDSWSTAGALSLPQDDRKVVLTTELRLETLAYDDTCRQLQQAVADVGGFVQSSSVSGNTGQTTRGANFTMRVPVERYNDFMQLAGEAGNVLSREESLEEVTSQYTDIEARLKSLRTKEQRLLEMMETTGTLADLLLLEDELSDVQYEIERYTTDQRRLDDLITYSTVHIYVTEVAQITEPVEDSYWALIGATFRDAWRAAGEMVQFFGLALAWLLPRLVIIAIIPAIALLVVFLVRRRRRRHEASAPPVSRPVPPPPPPPGAPPTPYAPYPAPRIGPAKPGAPSEDAPPAGDLSE
ncbi:MAG: DUF4349 domain-containing protein [Oscillospiraceae bacterium]